jgi:hypothetical protein
MVERICQACRFGNAIDSHYCAKCGAALERQLPVRLTPAPLTIAGRQLPVTWRQVGKTVALSAAAVAAEVGLSWLRRRIDGGSAPLVNPDRPLNAAGAPPASDPSITPSITIVSQRIIEILDGADGRRVINDRHIWRKFGGK